MGCYFSSKIAYGSTWTLEHVTNNCDARVWWYYAVNACCTSKCLTDLLMRASNAPKAFYRQWRQRSRKYQLLVSMDLKIASTRFVNHPLTLSESATDCVLTEAVVYKSTHNFRGDLLPRRTRAEGETDEKRKWVFHDSFLLFSCVSTIMARTVTNWSLQFFEQSLSSCLRSQLHWRCGQPEAWSQPRLVIQLCQSPR